MVSKFYLFDFDDTLVNTKDLGPYRGSSFGRDYIANNPLGVPSFDVKGMQNLINIIHGEQKCGIVSNSPKNYILSFLEKHGFPIDIPICSNMNKPNLGNLKGFLDSLDVRAEDTILVGDSAKDILTAQEMEMASIGVKWGYSSSEKLEKAGANVVVSNVEELSQGLQDFKNNEFGFVEREQLNDAVLFKGLENELFNIDMQFCHLGDYVSFGVDKDRFYSTGSDKILSFKRMKDVSIKNIKKGYCEQYFYNGVLKNGNQLSWVYKNYVNRMESVIDSLNLGGKFIIYGLPNSLPEFCYKTDINHLISKKINENVSNFVDSKRLYRLFPISSVHTGGFRGLNVQFNTMGIEQINFKEEVKNVILFDDISTTKTQLNAAGKLIRKGMNFNGNLYGLTLGQTNNNY